MALINCYECNQGVSSDANACPKCGAPIGKSIQKANVKAAANRKARSCLGRGCLLIFGGFFALCLLGIMTAPNGGRIEPKSKNSSIDPSQVIRKLKTIGMKQDIPWKKSRVEDGWIAQTRCYVDSNGNKTPISNNDGKLFNELNCQLTGPRESSVSLIEIEVEVYDLKSESQTLEYATELVELCFPSCPGEILKALKSGESTQLPYWKVETIPNGAGYETRLMHRPPNTKSTKTVKKKKRFEKKQKFGANKGTAFVMAQSFVKQTLKSPSSASFGSVFNGDWQNPDGATKHLGNDKYEISAWVDSQNSFGATVRKNFTCVVEKNSDNTWSCLSVDVDD